jgi:hypothetical protein
MQPVGLCYHVALDTMTDDRKEADSLPALLAGGCG